MIYLDTRPGLRKGTWILSLSPYQHKKKEEKKRIWIALLVLTEFILFSVLFASFDWSLWILNLNNVKGHGCYYFSLLAFKKKTKKKRIMDCMNMQYETNILIPCTSFLPNFCIYFISLQTRPGQCWGTWLLLCNLLNCSIEKKLCGLHISYKRKKYSNSLHLLFIL